MKIQYCPSCGAKLTENARFCSGCGQKIEQPKESKETKTKQCPSCDYSTTNEEAFCPECGTALISSTKPERPKKEPVTQHTAKKKHPAAKKKTGFLRALGKLVLWVFAFLVVVMIALYFIGDSKDSEDYNREETLQNIADKEMGLPPVKIRDAQIKLSETTKFNIRPTNEAQVFTYNMNTKISVPPDFAINNQTLAVSIASIDPAIYIDDALPLSILDLTLDDGKQPLKPVEVAFNYDPARLNPNFTTEEQLEAYRWDEAGGGWVSLPMRFDDRTNTVYALVDHFSIPALFIKVYEIAENFVDELKAIKLAKKTAEALDKGITELEENIINDCYITPQKNFKILYSKSAILADPDLNSKTWKKAPTGRTSTNKSDAPAYVQSVGYLLEQSLKAYTENYNFKNPCREKTGYFGSYQNPITVKLDSWFSNTLAQGNASYEKIFERLHIPTVAAWNYGPAKITLAHELFHRIQAEYYGVGGMYRQANSWWLEATAEYAAYQMAYTPQVVGTMDKGIGNDYLNFSLDNTGVIPKTEDNYGWTSREYQYITSIWVKYLIDNGANLEKMIAFDASDYKPPVYSLSSYFIENKQGSLGTLYRDFANEMTFSSKGSLNKYPYTTKGGKNDRDISVENSILMLGKKNEVSYKFENLAHLSAHLWAINLDKQQNSSSTKKSPVIVEVKDKTAGLTLDLFIIPKGQSLSSSPKPVKTLYKEDSSEIILLKEGDLICVVATQGLSDNGVADVLVRDASVQLEINPAELKDAVSNRAYPFEITAENIPKTIEKVKFEWDFGDGKKGSQGFQSGVAVNSETAETKIQHTYDESDKEETFPLSVTLKDDASGMTLATQEVTVTLPLKKPTVFITTRLLVGPPGATFDMEAVATPKGSYRFVWQVDGMAEAFRQTGEKSGIAPVISKKGKYNAVVSLYSADNTFLASDKVTISVEEEELNTEGIEGIVDIDEGIKESVQKAWVLTETKIDNRSERVARKNKSYTNVYNFEQTHSRNSNYSKQTFIGKTDTYYNPPKKQGESLAAQFNWTDPPKYINPGDKITIHLNGKMVSENLSFFGFGFHMAAGVCIYKKGADDANWCESLRNDEGKSSQACNKKNRSFSEKVSVDKIPKGDKDEILIINVSGGIEGARTEYIYEWK